MPSIEEVATQYQAWAESYYRKHGEPTRTANNVRDALRELNAVCGADPVERFSPLRLHQVQQAMIDSGRLSRRTINDRTRWIRAMFEWAATMELVDELLPLRLSRVKSLRAPKPKPRPVAWEAVSETIAHAPLKIATMIEIQWHTGMRPGELARMARGSIDQAGETWVYRPDRHKTEHHGRERVILIGPLAQSCLRTWLPRVRSGCDWIFEGHKHRKPTGQPMRPLSYYRAIQRINTQHGIPHWTPHQLRHAAGTRIRKAAGLEAAQCVLGHAAATTTEIYAEPDQAAAIDAVSRLG